jgi:hypothetical protein
MKDRSIASNLIQEIFLNSFLRVRNAAEYDIASSRAGEARRQPID